MNRITTNTQLQRLFEKLDARISETVSLFIIGGANLIAVGHQGRETEDIDVISPPEFSTDIARAITEVAKQEDLDPHWLNTMPSRDEGFLAKGWKKRAVQYFSGARLSIYLVSRIDMIGLKLAAALDRGVPDMGDLLAMAPSDEEWETGRMWAREYDANPDWPGAIDRLVESLKEKQRGH